MAPWRAEEERRAAAAAAAEGGDKLNGFHFRSKIGESRGKEKQKKRRPFFFLAFGVITIRGARERTELLPLLVLSVSSLDALFPHLPLSRSLTCAAPKSHLIYRRRWRRDEESNLRSGPVIKRYHSELAPQRSNEICPEMQNMNLGLQTHAHDTTLYSVATTAATARPRSSPLPSDGGGCNDCTTED